jgi:hypothetical protein
MVSRAKVSSGAKVSRAIVSRAVLRLRPPRGAKGTVGAGVGSGGRRWVWVCVGPGVSLREGLRVGLRMGLGWAQAPRCGRACARAAHDERAAARSARARARSAAAAGERAAAGGVKLVRPVRATAAPPAAAPRPPASGEGTGGATAADARREVGARAGEDEEAAAVATGGYAAGEQAGEQAATGGYAAAAAAAAAAGAGERTAGEPKRLEAGVFGCEERGGWQLCSSRESSSAAAWVG